MDDKRRLFTFMIVAMAVMWLMMMQQQRKRAQWIKDHPEWVEQQEALRAAQQGFTTGTLGANNTPTSVVLTANGQQGGGSQQPVTVVNPYDALTKGEETLTHIDTGKLKVLLTDRGGRPVSWQVAYSSNGKDGDEPEYTEFIPQRKGDDGEELLDERRELPLEIEFKQYNESKYSYHVINKFLLETSRIDNRDGTTVVSFRTPEAIYGLMVEKIFTFYPDSYVATLKIVVTNQTPQNISIYDDEKFGLGLSWGPGFLDYQQELSGADIRYINTISAGPDEIYHKPPKDSKPRLDKDQVLWGGQQNKFFTAIIAPLQEPVKSAGANSIIRSRNKADDSSADQQFSLPFTYLVYSDEFSLEPAGQNGSEKVFTYGLFTGPKERSVLKSSGAKMGELMGADEDVSLSRLIFYGAWWGWWRAICVAMLWGLENLEALTNSWGLSIILLTIIIRLMTHPLAHKGMKDMARNMEDMKRIKPELDALNEKYKSEPSKKQQAMMDLYKKHGINPFATLKGCLPMLVQLPIFIGLYSLLNQSIQLRGAEFLYIADLSQPDQLIRFSTLTFGMLNSVPFFGEHFNLLPILMGISTFGVSKFSSSATPSDPNQKIILYMMPIMLPVMCYQFASGLFIYWLSSNIWQFCHQFYAKKIVGEKKTEEQGRVAAAAATKETAPEVTDNNPAPKNEKRKNPAGRGKKKKKK